MRQRLVIILGLLAVISCGITVLSMRYNRLSELNRHDDQLEKSSGEPSLPLVHIVREGETLGEISLRYYGTAAKWNKILEANKDVLKSPEKLRPDMVLTLPRPEEGRNYNTY